MLVTSDISGDAKYVGDLQFIYLSLSMSISEQQYYEAKVFLTQLAEAHRILE